MTTLAIERAFAVYHAAHVAVVVHQRHAVRCNECRQLEAARTEARNRWDALRAVNPDSAERAITKAAPDRA